MKVSFKLAGIIATAALSNPLFAGEINISSKDKALIQEFIFDNASNLNPETLKKLAEIGASSKEELNTIFEDLEAVTGNLSFSTSSPECAD